MTAKRRHHLSPAEATWRWRGRGDRAVGSAWSEAVQQACRIEERAGVVDQLFDIQRDLDRLGGVAGTGAGVCSVRDARRLF
jgi:hypothetical protein